jgi:hypothetical protein
LEPDYFSDGDQRLEAGWTIGNNRRTREQALNLESRRRREVTLLTQRD